MLLVMVGCFIDVAVIVANPVMPFAAKVTDVAVEISRAGGAQASPAHFQVTPMPPSFAAVTLMVRLSPRSITATPPGKSGKVSVTAEVPQPPRIAAATKIKHIENHHAVPFMTAPLRWLNFVRFQLAGAYY